MKMIKCDKPGCNNMDEGQIINFGVYPFYMGDVTMYQYSDVPEIIPRDLCREHAAELNLLVDNFMNGRDEGTFMESLLNVEQRRRLRKWRKKNG